MLPKVSWNLHKLMGERRLKISEVARMTGLGWTTVSNIYHGRTNMVSLETIAALCAALGCRPGDLFEYISDEE